jgi:hypothetical protein
MKQIDPRHLLVKIAKIFDQLKIPYIVTGGMAVLIWGRPRFTADIDIVIELQPEKIDDLEKALLELGKAGYADKEAMQQALERHGEFNFIDGETGMKVDFWIGKGTEFDLRGFKRKKAKTIKGQRVYFISPEDLILSKLKWYQKSQSTRHLEDIESILKISGRKLNMRYLKQWARKLGVSKILSKLI